VRRVVVNRRLVFALGLVLAVLALSGCGGDDDSAAETTVDAPTATGSENSRLSQESWDTYVEARDEARTVNAEATKTFRRCRTTLPPTADTQQVEACLGDSLTDLVSEGEQALETLEGFEDEVGGACAAALAELEGNLTLYIASVKSLEGIVEQGDPAGAQAAIDNAATALEQERQAFAPFEAACKPAGA
jgi:hypothetical protein